MSAFDPRSVIIATRIAFYPRQDPHIRANMNTTAKALALTLAVLASGSAVSAQQYSAGPKWQAWVGCWAPVAPAGTQVSAATPLVCLMPTADANVAEIAAISGGKVVSREKLDASGRETHTDARGCNGTQQARWSVDERRVFMRSTLTCDGTTTHTSAMLVLTGTGDWLDVRRVTAGEGENVRVARYRDAGIPRDLPPEITAAVASANVSHNSARIAAGAAVPADGIVEASKLADAGVVKAWVQESGQEFSVDSRSLVSLADAGVPNEVTDAMIATQRTESLADYAAVALPRAPYGRAATDGWDQGTGMRVFVTAVPAYDPWGFGWRFGYPLGFVPYGSTFGYWGSGYGYGFGFNTFGPPGPWGYYAPHSRVSVYYPPVIVLHNRRTPAHVTDGHHYAEEPQRQAHEVSPPNRAAQPSAPPQATPPAQHGQPASAPAPSSGTRSAKARP